MTKRPITAFKRQAAKKLRAATTDAEAALWRHLKRFEIDGSHFRRQAVIGPYVADFVCLSAKLIVEVDGSQHGEDDGRRRDDVRTRWLEAEGYCVIRFWNNQVLQEIEGVLEAIRVALLHPTPRA